MTVDRGAPSQRLSRWDRLLRRAACAEIVPAALDAAAICDAL